MSKIEYDRAKYETRQYKKRRQEELCDLLGEVSDMLYEAYERDLGRDYKVLYNKVEKEFARRKCKTGGK